MIIRRIGVLSAAKMGGVLGVALGLLAGVLMFLASSLGGMASGMGAQGGGLMAGMGLLAIIVMPVLYGIFMFIAAAINALIYKLSDFFTLVFSNCAREREFTQILNDYFREYFSNTFNSLLFVKYHCIVQGA